MYVIQNVAYGLRDIKQWGEEHGKVDLHNISIAGNVYLKDNLMLEEQ